MIAELVHPACSPSTTRAGDANIDPSPSTSPLGPTSFLLPTTSTQPFEHHCQELRPADSHLKPFPRLTPLFRGHFSETVDRWAGVRGFGGGGPPHQRPTLAAQTCVEGPVSLMTFLQASRLHKANHTSSLEVVSISLCVSSVTETSSFPRVRRWLSH